MLPANFEVTVVGVSFVPRYPGALLELMQLDLDSAPPDLMVARDPENPVDEQAVAVLIEQTREPLGHVPARLAARLADEMDAGIAWAVERWEVGVVPTQPELPGLTLWLRRAG